MIRTKSRGLGGGAMLPGWRNAHIGTWIEVGCKYRDLDGSQVGTE